MTCPFTLEGTLQTFGPISISSNSGQMGLLSRCDCMFSNARALAQLLCRLLCFLHESCSPSCGPCDCKGDSISQDWYILVQLNIVFEMRRVGPFSCSALSGFLVRNVQWFESYSSRNNHFRSLQLLESLLLSSRFRTVQEAMPQGL